MNIKKPTEGNWFVQDTVRGFAISSIAGHLAGMLRDNQEANAYHICKCVNAFPQNNAAMQAARDLLASMPIPEGYYTASYEVIELLDNALKERV